MRQLKSDHTEQLEPLAASIFEAVRLTDALQAVKNGATSFSDIAKALAWYNRKNELDRSKVQRTIGRLKRASLVAVEYGRHILTEKGKIWSSGDRQRLG
jgi:hypothetical protein